MGSQQPMSHRSSDRKTRDTPLLLGTARDAQAKADQPLKLAHEAVEEQSVVSFPRKRFVDELGEVVKAANKAHNVVEEAQNVVANVASSFRPWRAPPPPDRPASPGAATSSDASSSGRREPAMKKIAHFIDENRVEPTLRPLDGKQPKIPKQQPPKVPQDGIKRGRGRPKVEKVKRPRGRPLGSQSSERTKKPGPSKGKQYARKPEWEAGFERPFFWSPPGPKVGSKRREGAAKPGPKVGSKGWRAGIGRKPHWKKSGPKPGAAQANRQPSPELPPFPGPTFKRPARWDLPFPDWIKKHKKHRPNDDGAGPSGGAAAVSKR